MLIRYISLIPLSINTIYLIRKINTYIDTFTIGVEEKLIMKKAFDLILSFDDVITHGYRESVTMS